MVVVWFTPLPCQLPVSVIKHVHMHIHRHTHTHTHGCM